MLMKLNSMLAQQNNGTLRISSDSDSDSDSASLSDCRNHDRKRGKWKELSKEEKDALNDRANTVRSIHVHGE